MCTTYTWLTYGLPDGRQQRARPAAAMAGIREEDEAVEEAGCPGPRRHPYAAGGSLRPRRARHWMGLAIVGVQMAAWCLVGALLMHRGVTTLKRRDAALLREVYTVAPTVAATASTALPGWTMQNDVFAEPSLPSEMQPPSPPPSTTPGQDDAPAVDDDDFVETSWNDMMKKWSSFVPVRPAPGLHAARDDDAGLGGGSPFGPAPTAPAGVLPGMGRAGTGAATAVVMVTVGGVMLVVGPAFMFIKIMDVYQRQKRLSKLSQHDDPPPSYDEVAEKAPRYSALFQVLENGELTPLALPAEGCPTALAAPGSGPASVPAAGETSPTPTATSTPSEAPASAAAGPSRASSGDAEPEASQAGRPGSTNAIPPATADEDAEAEDDACTPLRPKKDQAAAGVDDKSRRRSV